MCFFVFFQFKVHKNIIDLSHGNQKCACRIANDFLFKKPKFSNFKICHDGSQGSKHNRFKSKKQTFKDFDFCLFEAMSDPF